MEGSKEESGLERSSTSRHLKAGGHVAASRRGFGLIAGSSSKEEEVAGDGKRSFDTTWLKTTGGSGGRSQGEVSLREWLDKHGRSVDFMECLHIFRQVVETVNRAHHQGVVVNNIRPSCFVMSTFNSVSFIESASCSGSDSDSSYGEEEGSSCGAAKTLTPGEGISAGAFESSAHATQLSLVEEMKRKGELSELSAVGERRYFPLKKLLSMEFNWYKSPEETQERQSVFASDVYKLGVLLFELFCMFETMEEKLGIMSNLRHRVLPPQMLLKWPNVASFCLWLLHPEPSNRPKMSEVLQSEFLNEKRDSLEEREVAIKLKEEIEEQELLLEFLLNLQRTKQEAANMFHHNVSFLSGDIEVVRTQRSMLMKESGFLGVEKGDHSSIDKIKSPLPSYEIDDDSDSSGSRKRSKPECKDCVEANHESQGNVFSKSSRIMDNFRKLEAAYFSSRCKHVKPACKLASKKLLVTNTSRGSTDKTQGSSVDDLVSKESQSGSRMGEWINPFLDGLRKYLTFSKFRVCAELKQGDLLNSSNLICSLAFDRDKNFFATAGVNKKIKVFEYDAIINDDRDIHYPLVEMACRSKLSNVCWNSYIKSQIASSDFEGVVQIWDVPRSQVLVEMREHEKRVWSVDYSLTDPTMLATGSDDGTVKLWNINQAILLFYFVYGGSTGTIRTKANVCSVQFSPESGRIIAVGSADHNVYCYDLRNIRIPLCKFVGHSKTVSYVKFLDSSNLISSSTDNTIKLWELSMGASRVLDNPNLTFSGHTNVKNFVGLSISDGYIATGSETNEVFVYQKAFPMPVMSYNFGCIDPISGLEDCNANQFISCVCWRDQSSTLVAANSSGNIKILEMV
ncbi:Protein SPA1-RELATED 3 [Dendrobium catenatum]|uniref:Protein SPA1-RELATED 3 n=1 Tax=Dendrobium catenatum TaxID=906689 RepID=A0A2I0XJ37_9ASPA|nr:Protein SPA1-RELATED 3 [Dendrobium catenatum]